MTQMPLFLSRMSVVAGAVIVGLVVASDMAIAQAQNPPAPTSPPPAKSTPPVETDIGRVTTESGQGENAKVVVPSATIDRAESTRLARHFAGHGFPALDPTIYPNVIAGNPTVIVKNMPAHRLRRAGRAL